jgi:hypothetical protein
VFFPQKKEVTFHFLFYLFINDVHRHSDNGRVAGQHCHPERNAVKPKDPTNGVPSLPMGSFDVAQDDKGALRMTRESPSDTFSLVIPKLAEESCDSCRIQVLFTFVIPTLHKNHYYS